jgi:hypothetical protein
MEASLDDMASQRVYVNRQEDYAAVENACRSRLGDVPADYFVQRAGLIGTGQSHGMVSNGVQGSVRIEFHLGHGNTLNYQFGEAAAELLPFGCREVEQPSAAVLTDQTGGGNQHPAFALRAAGRQDVRQGLAGSASHESNSPSSLNR